MAVNSDWWDEPVDEVVTVVDDDGEEVEVEFVYGDEDWRDVIARVIRNHYLD